MVKLCRMRWLVAALLLSACSGRQRSAPAAPSTVTADDETVVAVVDGQPIRVADVRRQAIASGTTPRAALEALIEAELVAAEAARRGLERHPEVQEGVAQTLVKRLLATTFEQEVLPAHVTQAEIDQMYERNRGHFDRPTLVEVHHILALADAKTDPATHAAAKARAATVAVRAKAVRSVEEFDALAAELSDDKIKLRLEKLPPFPRTGAMVESFAEAAFALSGPGAVSSVVTTSYGYHVIFFLQQISELHTPRAQAEEDLRSSLFEKVVRPREFQRFVDRMMERHRIAVQPTLAPLESPPQ